MGQYYVLCNLDSKQFVNLQKLGSGLKLWEVSMSNVPRILPYLLRETDSSGGGDPRVRLSRDDFRDDSGDVDVDSMLEAERQQTQETYQMMGSWSGDRVVFLGDYSEMESEDYDTLYQEIHNDDSWTDVSRQVAQEVSEFLGDDERSPTVPRDPEVCKHDGEDDLFLLEYRNDDSKYGEAKCRSCHDTIVLEARQDWIELRNS